MLHGWKQAKMVDNAHPLAPGILREVRDGETPRCERFLIQVLSVARGEEAVKQGEGVLQAIGASAEGSLEVKVAHDDRPQYRGKLNRGSHGCTSGSTSLGRGKATSRRSSTSRRR
jgi:hypothetical protein